MSSENERLVVGLFATDEAASEAGKSVYEWQMWEENVSLGAMAVLTVDESGELHADEIGQRHTKRGLGWGTAVGAAVGILSGGVGLIPGMIVGGAAGAGLGALNHKSVGMSDEQHERLIRALRAGGAALAIMCDDAEVPAVVGKLKDEGAAVNHYRLQNQAAQAIADAAAAQAVASRAVDETAENVANEDLQEVVDAISGEVEPQQIRQVSTLAVLAGLSGAEAIKMQQAGVNSASQVLELAATPSGRKALAKQTGIAPETLLGVAKRLDLMRIEGVGVKEASLLIAAGVDSVPELAARNPGDVAEQMQKANEERQIVEELPSKAVVAGWSAQAQTLPKMVYF